MTVHSLLDVLTRAAEDSPTCVVFDEFSSVARVEHAAGVLRTHLQHHFQTLGLVFAGSEPSMMRMLFSDQAQPFYAQADLVEIGPLDDAAVVDIVNDGFASTDRRAGPVPGASPASPWVIRNGRCSSPTRHGAASTPARRRPSATWADALDDVRQSTAAGLERLYSALREGEKAVLRVLASGGGIFGAAGRTCSTSPTARRSTPATPSSTEATCARSTTATASSIRCSPTGSPIASRSDARGHRVPRPRRPSLAAREVADVRRSQLGRARRDFRGHRRIVPAVLRMSTLFLRTLREDPVDAELPSHRLLTRAGYIRRAAPGGFTWLPLGWIVYRNVEAIVRDEMNAAGFQEVHFPALLPKGPYEASNRWTEYGDAMFRLKDRRGNDFLLAPTHEEMFTLLVKDLYSSYKDLPLVIYQIQTKYRDEPRPRAGLLRGREFVMKDSYSFDIDDDGLDVSYQRHRDAYIKTFERLGMPFVIVSALSGAMGGSASEEFLAPIETGEDTFVRCPSCGYAANVEAVRIAPAADDRSTACPQQSSTTRPTRRRSPRSSTTSTPATISPAADRPSVDRRRHAEERRRDASPSRRHPRAAGDRRARRPRRRHQAAGGGRAAGRAGAVRRRGLRPLPDARQGLHRPGRARRVVVVGHPLPRRSAGRHRDGVGHRRRPRRQPRRSGSSPGGTSPPTARSTSPTSSPATRARTAVRRWRPLGASRSATSSSSAVATPRPSTCSVLDANGKEVTVTMGSYGIGVSRAVAAIAELTFDDLGLCWPAAVAPADVHVVIAGKPGGEQWPVAERLATDLEAAGVRVLLDDRDSVSPGVKFKDAELIGIPTIVVVGRGVADGLIEVRDRRSNDRRDVPIADAVTGSRRPDPRRSVSCHWSVSRRTRPPQTLRTYAQSITRARRRDRRGGASCPG